MFKNQFVYFGLVAYHHKCIISAQLFSKKTRKSLPYSTTELKTNTIPISISHLQIFGLQTHPIPSKKNPPP